MNRAKAFLGLTLGLLGLLLPSFSAGAGESVYTDLDLNGCKTVVAEEMGTKLICSGYRSYQVHFTEGDLRHSLFYGPIRKDIQEQAFESFEPFTRIDSRIEWRVDDTGRPHATILRWYLENIGANYMPDEKLTGEVLVISRVAQPNDPLGCVIGYVDALANPQPAELARAVADRYAANFKCIEQEARWHGRRGDKAAEPTHAWPEGELPQ